MRPKYAELLDHAFLETARAERRFDMGTFVRDVLQLAEEERSRVLQNIDLENPVSAAADAVTPDC